MTPNSRPSARNTPPPREQPQAHGNRRPRAQASSSRPAAHPNYGTQQQRPQQQQSQRQPQQTGQPATPPQPQPQPQPQTKPRQQHHKAQPPSQPNNAYGYNQPAQAPQQQPQPRQYQQQQPQGQQYPQGQRNAYQQQAPPPQPRQQQGYWAPQPPRPQDDPAEVKKRHEESKKQYPELNLSQGEFIISVIDRHRIGLWSIWFGSAAVSVAALGMLGFILFNQSMFATFIGAGNRVGFLLTIGAVALFMVAISALGSYLATYVYRKNKFIITNESIVQRIQKGLFSHREQTISLDNVRDASYFQNGILEHMVGYGNIRLSTVSDETTYRFSYVNKPKDQVALINNAVERYKKGRSMLQLENGLPQKQNF